MTTQPPILTVDAVLFTLLDRTPQPRELAVWLQMRDHDPFANTLALPGGFIRTNSDCDARAAISRILQTKVGLDSSEPSFLEQFQCVSGRHRDPRGWSMSDVWMTVCSPSLAATIASKANAAPVAFVPNSEAHRPHAGQWVPLSELHLHNIAFDHKEIILGATARLRSVASYSSLPLFFFGPQPFSITEAHLLTQDILGRPVDPLTFRKKFEQHFSDVLIPAGSRSIGGRPSKLFQLSALGMCRFSGLKPF